MSTTIDADDTALETASSSKIWESYIYSPLATKFVQDRSNSDQYSTTIEYHGGEMYANLYVAAPSVTSGSSAKIAVVKDTEVDSVKDKNLVVVGGSCINTVAAQILGSTTPLCGAAFSDKTGAGAGKYLIQVAASPVNSGKIAMLVAGYEAADTVNAVAKVKEGAVDTTKNGATVYPIAATA